MKFDLHVLSKIIILIIIIIIKFDCARLREAARAKEVVREGEAEGGDSRGRVVTGPTKPRGWLGLRRPQASRTCWRAVGCLSLSRGQWVRHESHDGLPLGVHVIMDHELRGAWSLELGRYSLLP